MTLRRTKLPLAAAIALALLPSPSAAQQVEYYHLDALGSVRAITDEQGAVVSRHDYLPYGEEWNPELSSDTRRFTGKERDQESGLDYFGARFYGSKFAIFTSVDPVVAFDANLVDPQRWNRYAYARGNPQLYVDPDGRAIETFWDAANVAIGVGSLAANIAAGNVPGALMDAGGLALDVAATALPGVPGGAATGLKTVRAARAARLAANARFGKAFEKAVLGALDLSKNSKRVDSFTATARFRIPDAFTKGILLEVKGVKNFKMTNQVRDFLEAAGRRKVVFAVRSDTKISGKFREFVDKGRVAIVRFTPE